MTEDNIMEMTRGEVQDLLAKFSSESATYRDRVKSDAKDVIEKWCKITAIRMDQAHGKTRK